MIHPATRYHTLINPHPLAQLRLICLYYAGGNSSVFRPWAQLLGPLVEVVTVELPGHGARIYEPLATEMADLVPQLAAELAPLLAAKPFALFGHSMGALVSFELARYLRQQGLPGPRWLFVSGRQAPQLPPRTAFHRLGDAPFTQALAGLQGTPESVLEHPELMELFLPIIRADFQVCETYAYQPQPPLDCPIAVYSGSGDPSVEADLLHLWAEQTTAEFACQLFPGGHFYLRDAQAALLQSVRSHLLKISAQLQERL